MSNVLIVALCMAGVLFLNYVIGIYNRPVVKRFGGRK